MYDIIGLSKKAGKLESGSFAVESSIKSGKAKLVIVSGDVSQNTEKKFRDMCEYRNIDMIKVGNNQELGECIGKPNRTVLVINDTAFKDMLLGVLPSSATNLGVIN